MHFFLANLSIFSAVDNFPIDLIMLLSGDIEANPALQLQIALNLKFEFIFATGMWIVFVQGTA